MYSYSTDWMQLSGWSPIILAIVVWSLFWKSAALWHAARNKQLGWFIALAIINTAGILDIVYLFVIEKSTTDKLFK